MRIKIDTKERFQVITLLEANLTARMAEELQEKLLTGLGNDKAPDGGFTHLVLSLSEVQTVEDAAASILVVLQNQFYEKGYSFVICCMQKEVEDQLNKLELLQ